MFNMGFSELLILAAIALIVIGPKQMPEMARMIGRLLNEWKRATSDLKSTLTTDLREDLEHRRKVNAQNANVPPVPPPEPAAGAVPPVPPPDTNPSGRRDSGDKA